MSSVLSVLTFVSGGLGHLSPSSVQSVTIALIMLIVHLEWDPSGGPSPEVLLSLLTCAILPTWFRPWPLLEPMSDDYVVGFFAEHGKRLWRETAGEEGEINLVRDTVATKFAHLVDVVEFEEEEQDE